MAREVRCWVTDRQTHMTTTVTLAAHVRQGLRENGFFDNRYASTLLFACHSMRGEIKKCRQADRLNKPSTVTPAARQGLNMGMGAEDTL
jgi:hypothetical protein